MKLTKTQVDAIDWCIDKKRGLLPLPVGIGKTAIGLHVIDYLQVPALVVSTKHIVGTTWPDEIEKWGLPISYAAAIGSKGLRRAAINKVPQLLGVNFENLKWYYEQGHDLVDRKLLIIDESSKMKDFGAQRVRSHLKYKHQFDYAFALSATPAPEGFMGLWSQFTSVLEGFPLGRITEFRRTYFDMQVRPTHTEYTPKPGALAAFSQTARPWFYKPEPLQPGWLGIPEPREIEYRIPWSSEVAFQQYRDMAENLCIESGEDYDLDRMVAAASPGVLQNKLRQMASGFLYDDTGETLELLGYNDKLDQLAWFLDEIADVPVVVFTQFLEEQEQIKDRFPKAHLGLPDSLDEWNQGEIPLLVLHPKSAGHGLNLQHGSSIVVFYSLPWSADDYYQSIGRLHRRGQTQQVTVARLVREGTIESRIYRVIREKQAIEREIVESIHGNSTGDVDAGAGDGSGGGQGPEDFRLELSSG